MQRKEMARLFSCAAMGFTLMSSGTPAWTAEGITPDRITQMVNQLKSPNISPQDKVSHLPRLYDIIKKGQNINADVKSKAVEGAKTIWKDLAIRDGLLENVLAQYFSSNLSNLTEDLKNHFLDTIFWDNNRPARFDRIVSETLQKHIIEPLLISNANLTADSMLMKNKEIRHAFQYALWVLDGLLTAGQCRGHFPERRSAKLSSRDREFLLDSIIKIVKEIPYFSEWGLYENNPRDFKQQEHINNNYRNAVKEQIALYMAGIYDLNPLSNPRMPDKQRREIKNKIKNALGLTGLYAKMWDDFTVLIGCGITPMNEKIKQFYYDALAAYPSVPIFIGHGRLLYGGIHPSKIVPASEYYVGVGIIEPGLHGIAHEIDEYLLRTKKRSRLLDLASAVGRKFGQYLAVFAYGFPECAPDDWPWGENPVSPPEMLACTVDMYMMNSRKLFDVALSQFDKGYKEPINQFVFILDIFCLETNVSRFYYLTDSYYFVDYSKVGQFTITNVPLTHNEKGNITSLTVDGRTYNFSLDNEGNVLSYAVPKPPH